MKGEHTSKILPDGVVPLPSTIHASAVVIGETGILIRGASGAGKSSLARSLIAAGELRGQHARLVGDDRIRLKAASGRLIAASHPEIAGKIETRGRGILEVAHEPAALIQLVVDLAERCGDLPRIPTKATTISWFGEIQIRRLQLPAARSSADLAAEILELC
jgi:HPr kinase/phosphorylase